MGNSGSESKFISAFTNNGNIKKSNKNKSKADSNIHSSVKNQKLTPNISTYFHSYTR